jgi:hypothetical protein
MTDATGTITYPPLERHELTFVVPEPAPDPRDAFIAEQEVRYFKLEQELNGANARIWQLEAAERNMIATARGLNDLCVEHERRAEVAQARIARLEAALREVRLTYSDPRFLSRQNIEEMLEDMMRTIDAVLPRPPEGDMRITQEELNA